MKADWLYKRGGQPCGPFTVEQLRQLAAAGAIDATTEIRREKDPRWFPAGRVPGLIPAVAPASHTVTTPAGRIDAEAAPAKPRPRTAPAAPTTPAGVRVSAAAAMPVGRPVTPTSRAMPVGKAVNGPTEFNFSPSPPASAPSKKADPTRLAKPRKSNHVLIVAASLGGLCALVAVLLAVLLAIDSPSGVEQTTSAHEAASKAPQMEQAAAGNGSSPAEAESNPVEPSSDRAEGEANESASFATVATSAATVSSSASQALAQIKSWNSLTGNRVQFGLKNVARFEVASVWLAADAGGRRVRMKAQAPVKLASEGPVLPSTADALPAPGGKLEPVETPLYVFAELRITNSGSTPVNYQGWNAPADTTAILVDATGGSLQLVPASETPKIARLEATDIPPGGLVTDIVVFRAPATFTQSLRLALPKPALSSLAKGFFAIEVPPATLLRESVKSVSTALANSSLTGPGETAARDEFAELQRQIMESEPTDTLQPAADVSPASPPAAAATDGPIADDANES